MAGDLNSILLAAGAGMLGGAMNALAGGGTFATLPALIALGLPANIANATSNVALLPGAGASAWTYRDELRPVAGMSLRLLAGLTFAFGLITPIGPKILHLIRGLDDLQIVLRSRPSN
jgi:uncharacterized protein